MTRTSRLLTLAAVAAAYIITGRAGLATYTTEVGATLVWPPTGISIAAVFILGYRVWPAIWVGSLVTNLMVIGQPGTAMVIACGNTGEALLAVWLLRHLCAGSTPFDNVRDVLAFLLAACMVSPLLSASVGVSALAQAGLIQASDFAAVWQLWWFGDLMGALMLSPILILFAHRHEQVRNPHAGGPAATVMESGFTLACGLALVTLVYGDYLDEAYRSRITYLPIIPMLWAALRLGRLSALFQNMAVAALAIGLVLIGGREDGKLITNNNLMLLYLFLLVQNSVILLVTAVVQERNRMDEDLARARRMAEEASEQKSRFLTNISHEIRTPLNGILGVAAMLMPDLSKQQHREQLRIIRSSADSLLNILNDVLDHARIEAGKLDINRHPFPLHQLVKDVCGLFGSQAESRGLSLRARIDNNIPRYVIGDDTRVRQILVNLVSNAVKFTNRGSIEVSVSRPDSQADTIRFVVRDTGIGIPANAIKTIFTAFTQADSSTSRLYGGSGLGLTISKQLAEHLGGNLELVSLEGVGTEVTVSLPLPATSEPARSDHLEAPTPQAGTQTLSPSTAGKRVLVAEDNAINAQVTEQMLHRLGYDVTLAADGEQALACWQKGFDLILMDCNMPTMDGYETTRAIRQLERDSGSHIPIVALTANAMSEERDRCLGAGMDDYLAKPIRLAQLDNALKRHLAG